MQLRPPKTCHDQSEDDRRPPHISQSLGTLWFPFGTSYMWPIICWKYRDNPPSAAVTRDRYVAHAPNLVGLVFLQSRPFFPVVDSHQKRQAQDL